MVFPEKAFPEKAAESVDNRIDNMSKMVSDRAISTISGEGEVEITSELLLPKSDIDAF